MTRGAEQETAGERARWAWLLTAAFVLLTIPRLLMHELWRDEAWLWLVVRESRTFSELLAALGRSGQGYLFPFLCVLAGEVSASPRSMQALHLVLAAAAAFVFLRFAPFGRRERTLFLVGYFPFYEYAVLSRHYVAGTLLAWVACAAARGERRALVVAAAIALLCQTTVYGFVIAIAVACGWLCDRWLRRHELLPVSRFEWGSATALVLAGGVAGLVQLVPASGTSFAPGWRFDPDFAHAREVLAMVWRVIVPLPRLGVQFWNTNFLDGWPATQAAGGLLALGLLASLLWRSKVALITFAIGTAGLLTFAYVKYLGVMRHQGHLWLLFAAALWLGATREEERRSWRSRVLLALLIIHAVAGVYASWIDLRHPFSNGAAIAELLRSEKLDAYPLLGHREPPISAVALPLGRPLYSPSRRVFATHPDWGPEQREMSDEELRCVARELTASEGRDLVLVINRELPPWQELTPAGSRVGAIQPTEDFYLYRLDHRLLTSTARAAGCSR